MLSPNSKNLTVDQAAADDFSEPTVSVKAPNLTIAYDENEIAADRQYRGKLLLVSGYIAEMSQTSSNMIVQLRGHDGFQSVRCIMRENQRDMIVFFKKGQEITLVGRGEGRSINLFVGLSDCRIR